MTTTVAVEAEFAPLPGGCEGEEPVPAELLRKLIREETVPQLRWAKWLPGDRVAIGMPQGCTLVLPADPGVLLDALRPAYAILAKAAGVSPAR